MTEPVVIVVEGLRELEDDLGNLPKKVERAVYRAMNRTADRTRTRLARMVRDQVAFPASYVGPSAGRLTVAKRARSGDLEVRIRGRDRPTSLARFTKTTKVNKRGVRLTVKPGLAQYKSSAFIVRLKHGNRLLAVRTPDGSKPKGAYKPQQLKDGLWLLYGPSVDQVLQGVRARRGGAFGEVEEWAAEELEKEFFRLMNVEID